MPRDKLPPFPLVGCFWGEGGSILPAIRSLKPTRSWRRCRRSRSSGKGCGGAGKGIGGADRAESAQKNNVRLRIRTKPCFLCPEIRYKSNKGLFPEGSIPDEWLAIIIISFLPILSSESLGKYPDTPSPGVLITR